MILKDLVQEEVHFQYYQMDRDGIAQLWYKTDSGFLFPVPINECDNAMFKRDDRGMFFMKWIGRQVKVIKDAVDLLNE